MLAKPSAATFVPGAATFVPGTKLGGPIYMAD